LDARVRSRLPNGFFRVDARMPVSARKGTNDERRLRLCITRRAFTDGRATAACVMCNLIMLEIALYFGVTISSMLEHDISHAAVESAT